VSGDDTDSADDYPSPEDPGQERGATADREDHEREGGVKPARGEAARASELILKLSFGGLLGGLIGRAFRPLTMRYLAQGAQTFTYAAGRSSGGLRCAVPFLNPRPIFW
jgi:hypothetical protein